MFKTTVGTPTAKKNQSPTKTFGSSFSLKKFTVIKKDQIKMSKISQLIQQLNGTNSTNNDDYLNKKYIAVAYYSNNQAKQLDENELLLTIKN